MLRIYIPWRLLHVYVFLEKTMSECTGNIELSQRPIGAKGNSKNQYHSGKLDHRTKCFSVVQTSLLMNALCHQFSLIPGYRNITIEFELKDPLAANQIDIGRRGYQCPSVLLLKSKKFNIHNFTPFRILSCNFVSVGSCVCVVKTSFVTKLGFDNPTLDLVSIGY